MRTTINLKPHEAAALARGETITIWRPVNPQPTETPDGEVTYFNKHGSYPISKAPSPFPLNVPLLSKETWRCVGMTGVSLSGVEQDAEWVDYACDGFKFGAWRSATQMPERFVRTLVTLSDVRVRKPCDVTEEEAKAMGFRETSTGQCLLFPLQSFCEKWSLGYGDTDAAWNSYHWSYTATPTKKQ